MADYTVSFSDDEEQGVILATADYNAEQLKLDEEHVDITDKQYFQRVATIWAQSYVGRFKELKAFERAKKIEKLDIGKTAQVDAILATVVEEEGEVIVVP